MADEARMVVERQRDIAVRALDCLPARTARDEV